MDRDQITHEDVLRRISERYGVGRNRMRKYARYYLNAVASLIRESDPERDIRMGNIGTIRVRKHKAHKGQNIHEGKTVHVPAHRSIRFDVSPRIDYVLKAPLKDFYDLDES